MTLKSDSRFQEKLTCSLVNDIRNLVNFHQSALESVKIVTLKQSFCPKQKIYDLKIQKGVMCNDTEE